MPVFNPFLDQTKEHKINIFKIVKCISKIFHYLVLYLSSIKHFL